jgi:hypothetical protein
MKRLLLAGALLVALMAPASAVAAGPYHPTGEFANFSDCPLTRTTLSFCLFSEQNKGSFLIGKKTVTIEKPQVLQGGLDKATIAEELEGFFPFVGAEDGNTLVKTPQVVPGGLLGITAPSWWPQILKDLFNETINNGATGVTATVELAGPASGIKPNIVSLVTGSGIALQLPTKIKLNNSFLGSNCYIGSNSNPVLFKFTTGTTSPPPPNKPITGTPATPSFNAAGTLLTLSGGKLVDNSFAAPGASGCGGILFSWAVDPLVNSIVGLPAPAGTNSATLEGKIEIAAPSIVKASE